MHREEKSLCKPLRQREVEVKLHPFLTTVLDGIVSCSYRDSKCNCSCRAACSLVTVLTIGINNCTANCTLHHVVQKPYQGVLDFKNITSFYGTSLYVISFTPVIYIYRYGFVLRFFSPQKWPTAIWVQISKTKYSPKYVICTILGFCAAGVIVSYRRFGTTCKFHLHQSKHA